jgi:5'-nucleotidase
VRILVTNDDGIDSKGLYPLARMAANYGEVTVVAPASEYSGSGASLGTLTHGDPKVRSHTIEELGDLPTWSVTGPPGLCVMYAQLGAFGDAPFDMIVSGINPGQNVGWSVYHSGTIGAALTGRNRGASGLAVSIGFDGREVEGQTWPEIVDQMNWEMGTTVAEAVLAGMVADPAPEPVVINLNVPNGELSDIEGWGEAAVGTEPPRRITRGKLVEAEADDDGPLYRLEMDWRGGRELVEGTDGWLVANKRASISWLGHLAHTTADPIHRAGVADRLDGLLG